MTGVSRGSNRRGDVRPGTDGGLTASGRGTSRSDTFPRREQNAASEEAPREALKSPAEFTTDAEERVCQQRIEAGAAELSEVLRAPEDRNALRLPSDILKRQ
ncbi:hypothetical protein FQA47_016566 [Oryzias melastigma]|uniref:Uncharacterized protein n=1 Tax=Oryzias melastigma TaxID=30732 RepID=A0A834F361_ORYME|nr:hypothetical protein FQA47_016566 [Oryzias melastigma]